MARDMDSFFADCTADSRQTFEVLFEEWGTLLKRLLDEGKITGYAGDFDQERGFSVYIQHPKLLHDSRASILWGFPDNVGATFRRSGLFTSTKDLNEAWVPHSIIDQLGWDLEEAGFIRRDDWKDWRSSTAGTRNGIHKLYHNDPAKRAALVRAIENLVNRLNEIEGQAPPADGAYTPKQRPRPGGPQSLL